MLNNPYAGLVVFIATPRRVFVMGLLLIPAGMWLQSKKLALHPEATADWPVIDLRQRHVRRTALVVTILTAINVVIILLAGYGSLHAMETPGLLRAGVPHDDGAAVQVLAGRSTRRRGV